jgi:hypothetical protein
MWTVVRSNIWSPELSSEGLDVDGQIAVYGCRGVLNLHCARVHSNIDFPMGLGSFLNSKWVCMAAANPRILLRTPRPPTSTCHSPPPDPAKANEMEKRG